MFGLGTVLTLCMVIFKFLLDNEHNFMYCTTKSSFNPFFNNQSSENYFSLEKPFLVWKNENI